MIKGIDSYNGSAQVTAVASIEIHLLPDGRVMARTTGNRMQFNLMMTTAMQDIVAQFQEQERSASRVAVAPPGLRLG